MAKTIYFDSRLGHSLHKGDSPFEAFRDANDFNKLILEPGDRVLFRAGQTFEGNFVLNRSGAPEPGKEITIDTYTLGGETTRWANFKADAASTRPIAWDINASYVRMAHLQASEARYCGFMFREKQGHVNGTNLRMRDCGIGARLRGSHIHLTHTDVQGAIMSRYQRKPTDEGGVAFSIEADGWLNQDNVIEKAFVWSAVASGDEKFDGGSIEIFGDVVSLAVDGCVFMFAKGGVEIGGPSRKPGETPTTTRDVIFRNNLFIHCGILAMFNDPSKDFPIRVKNMAFCNNTFYDRTRSLSAVWFDGKWGSLADAISFEQNIYSGQGSWIGCTDKTTTDLNSIKRTGNVYHRVSGTNIGYALSADEWAGDPSFANVAGFDFRLRTRPNNGQMKVYPGALDMAQTYNSEIDLKWLLKQTRTPLDANNFVGGLHSYPYHKQMWAIPRELRRAGMECAISAFDQRWRLDSDLTTWMAIAQ